MQENLIPVSTLNEYIKNIFDSETLLNKISVVGEISNFSVSGGNAYFTIKDEKAMLSCAMFSYNNSPFSVGDKVVVTGTPKFYVKGGKVSFNAINIKKCGTGDIYEQLRLLKEKLEKEGLFDVSHKKQFPKTINKIGVVTAENGAVIHDIMNVSTRRNSNIQIVLFPTKVQGQNAEFEIAKGIDYFSNSDVDAVIVGRGGGSEEDLMAYNTEIVARSAYNCKKFLVSAVGHETNYTIIDLVADLRAPTPSAAAELLVKETVNYVEKIKFLQNNLLSLIKTKLNDYANNIDFLSRKSLVITKNLISDRNAKLLVLLNNLKDRNPINILEKGFSQVKKDEKIVSSIKDVDVEDNVSITLKDGEIFAKVVEINGDRNKN